MSTNTVLYPNLEPQILIFYVYFDAASLSQFIDHS